MTTRSYLFIGITTFAAWTAPLAAQTVALSISSPQNGSTVAPGNTINWSIEFEVSAIENAGLALISVDLVQADANPAKLDLPPADAVPAAMANFSRPAGISNPGETNPTTGYTGVQRGPAGEKNLRQIGGAQNTFGQARPAGTGVAESANVVTGVGQGSAVTLASGSFAAPSTPGTYTFRLENPVANVLTEVNAPPQHSQAVGIEEVELLAASITFTVSDATCDACDANCDGENDGRDLQQFVDMLLSAQPTGCSPCAGDLNGNDGATVDDISQFVGCLLGA